jgi:hypothetical protein
MVDVPANTSTTETFETDIVGNIGSYSGRLESLGDHDWLRITLEAGFNDRRQWQSGFPDRGALCQRSDKS